LKESSLQVVQLKVGHMQNFTYLLIAGNSYCAVVDTSFGGRVILSEAKKRHIDIRYVLSTHSHFDHNNDNEMVKQETGAQICAHPSSSVNKDISLEDGSLIALGKETIKVISTPGHTPDSVCYIIPGGVFTGDTLFVGTCGRADLPGSDPRALYLSLKRLGKLPPETIVYPGHDYGSTKTSTIGRESMENPAMLQRSVSEFESFVLG
jgi:hydroxyacylglutathione hydrolase